MFDSLKETLSHIRKVQFFLMEIIMKIHKRSIHHDDSKLHEPEKAVYDRYTPMLRSLTYGSDEYKSTLKDMGVALEHHYAVNSHHPEHYQNGINGMNLIDLIEMISDWKAASLRHADGDILKSIKINKARFGISDQLETILINTIVEMGWLVKHDG
ncbi:MAG: hypothetical protein IPL32_18170 [Chloracidobacterium sp.]|nr:hypothetical protein [Chloracidobacterium sp.]